MLWLLKLNQKHDRDCWDCAYGFVVRAETEDAARKAVSVATYDNEMGGPGDEGRLVWLDNTKTTCEEITTDGPEQIILRDFNAG